MGSTEIKDTTHPLPWSILEEKAYNDTPMPDLVDTTGKRIFDYSWCSDTDRPALEIIVQTVNRYPALVAALTDLTIFVAAALDEENDAQTQATALELVQKVALKNARAALAGQAPEPPNTLLLSTLKLARSALTATMQAGADYDWNADPRYVTRMQGEAVRAIDAAVVLSNTTGVHEAPQTLQQKYADLRYAAGRVIRAYTMSDEEAGISGQDELNYAITDVLSGALAALGGVRTEQPDPVREALIKIVNNWDNLHPKDRHQAREALGWDLLGGARAGESHDVQ